MPRLVIFTNPVFISGAPSGNTKKVPAAMPMRAMNADTAAVTVIWYPPLICYPRYQITSDLVPPGTKSLGVMQTC